MKLIEKEYKKQKDTFHSNPLYRGRELHHIWGRIGVLKCCGHFLVPGEKDHQNNWQWVKILRDKTMEDKLLLENNYIKGMFCKKKIFAECEGCLLLQKEI